MTAGYAFAALAALTVALVAAALPSMATPEPVPLDLQGASIVIRPDSEAPTVERTAATVLADEVKERTGIVWRIAEAWPEAGWAIGIVSGKDSALLGKKPPARAIVTVAEGFGIATDMSVERRPVLWIVGADPRGALFGVGKLLRTLECRRGSVVLTSPLDVTEAPTRPIRGHQLGFRATANSYDAWQPEQYDRYIRELALFGTNAIENIPLQDDRPTAGGYPRDKMNVEISRICAKYGLDHWIWTPAAFDLKDQARRAAALDEFRKVFTALPHLTDVFVPGGDPGDNPPELVIPFLKDLQRLLAASHPNARIWLSMQGFSQFEQDAVYRWIEIERPAWFAGIAAGPSSPPLADIRARLPRPYRIRDYPDITHSVRCQFPVPWWDPAFAFTLGRECVNPRPVFHARIIRDTGVFTDGFVTYSDGVHDDVNKVLWSSLGWNPRADINTIVRDYCRLFFGPDMADAAASGVFALERNWEGALATNGSVDGTYALWAGLDAKHPELRANWRWQLCLLRAHYDLYTRMRLIRETELEAEANRRLLTAAQRGSETAITMALEVLKQADAPCEPQLRDRIVKLCEDLWHSIGLQTSVARFKASGPERGAVLDFLDYPLNNRWWLEDELAKVKTLPDEAARVKRLEEIARWEDPGPGSFYDDIGNVAKSPHEVRNERIAAPILDMDHMMTASFMWWVGDNPNARVRQSWISYEDWPEALRYAGVDPEADYVLRTAGYGDCFPRVNGVRLVPTVYGKELGAIKEFPIPRGLYRSGEITVTFEPTFEPHLNWRVQSRLCEVWLIRK
jgi:hypothetical protein